MAGDIDEVHAFWFGELDAQGMSPQARQALWFRSSAETDEQCRSRFGHLVDSAVSGGLGDWEVSDRGLVALVLLLDQLTRNIYRGTPAAYAGDPGHWHCRNNALRPRASSACHPYTRSSY